MFHVKQPMHGSNADKKAARPARMGRARGTNAGQGRDSPRRRQRRGAVARLTALTVSQMITGRMERASTAVHW